MLDEVGRKRLEGKELGVKGRMWGD